MGALNLDSRFCSHSALPGFGCKLEFACVVHLLLLEAVLISSIYHFGLRALAMPEQYREALRPARVYRKVTLRGYIQHERFGGKRCGF
jgi:hypothetical protein